MSSKPTCVIRRCRRYCGEFCASASGERDDSNKRPAQNGERDEAGVGAIRSDITAASAVSSGFTLFAAQIDWWLQIGASVFRVRDTGFSLALIGAGMLVGSSSVWFYRDDSSVW